MKVIRLDLKTQDQKIVDYPRFDLAPLPPLQGIYQYYAIVEEDKPLINHDFEKYSEEIQLTKDSYDGLGHILIAKKTYSAKRLPDSHIIARLTTAMGEWVDERVDVNKKVKYLSRYIYLQQLEGIGGDYWNEELALEKKWLEDVDTWYNQILIERDRREEEYLTNGTLPDLYSWEELPVKPN